MSTNASLKLGTHIYVTCINCWSLYIMLVKIGLSKCGITYSRKLEQSSMVTKILINIPFVKKLVNVVTKSCKKQLKCTWFCWKKSWGFLSVTYSEQLNCFNVRNLQAVMNKSCNIMDWNLWHNVQPLNRSFLVSHCRLKNNSIWKLGLVSNISKTENNLHNIFVFLNFCFSAIWSTNQPMPKR